MKKLLFTLIALLGMLPTMAQQSSAPLRVAVAGVTHDHLWNVANSMNRGDFKVVGVWEAAAEHRANNILTGKVAQDRFYADLDKMLKKTKPEVVVCYGPILDHRRVIEACAKRHVDVMVEKPLATTYKDALAIAQIAKKSGIKVLTNYETSWYDTNTYAKQLIDEGKLGKVFRINVYDGHQGPIEINCSKRFTDWLTDPVQNGGGAVVDFGCYGANLATWIFKNEQPVSVSAVLRTVKPDVYPKVDDDATITLNYKHATVNIMASWCWPMSRKDMYVYGLQGCLYQKNATDMEVALTWQRSYTTKAPKLQAPYDDSFGYLKAMVRGEITVEPTDLASIENNVLVVRILEAARQSAKTGKAVFL